MKFKMQSLTEVWNESKLYLMGFVALFGIVFGSAFTYQNVIKPITSTVSISTVMADEETAELSYSLYDMSAWLSAYYNAATSPSGWKTLEDDAKDSDYNGKALLSQAAFIGAEEGEPGKWHYATKTWFVNDSGDGGRIGGGGSLLGFPDKEVVDGGIIGFLSSKTSASTTDYSYSSLKTWEKGYNSLESYAYYGATLQSLGIDSSLGGGLMGWHPIRMLGGALIWLSYIIVSFVEKIFVLAIAILQVTNPFKWFATAMEYDWIPTDAGPLSGLVNLVSGTYKSFSYFGWAIMIPVIVSMLIFMTIFTGGGRQNPQLDQRRRSKFRYAIIYFLFLAVGVPFLGTAYTAGLDAMKTSFGTGFTQNSFSADAVILSTYVDNAKWIERHRMYLPDGANVTWNTGANDASADSKAAVRQTALAINALTYGAAENAQNTNGIAIWNMNGGTNVSTNNNVVDISNIIWKYMMGETYEAGTWETKVKSYLLKEANTPAKANLLSASALELTSDKGFGYLGYVDPHVHDGDKKGITIDGEWFGWFGDTTVNYGAEPNVFLDKGYADNGNGGITITTPNGSESLVLKSNPSITNNGYVGFGRNNATMSYLEMYNYLNSKFTSNKIRVYSTNALASNFTRDSHAEVNQVGSGMVHKFLIWFNTGVMLFGLAVLAVGYAFGMLIGAFRRYWDVIHSIFIGTLGLQKGMVRATAGTIMLIVETLGTLVIYELVKTFYIGVPSVIEGAFASIDLNGTNGTALMNFGFGTASTNALGFVGIIVALILSSGILIWSTFMLLRIRKPIIDIMDTTFTGLINKLFYGDGQVSSDAPKSVNPNDNGGIVGDVTAMGAGAVGGALDSNVDGAEGNDGEDGWSNSGTATSGDATSDSDVDGDGPDARVASSRDTEEVGAEIAENGKLNRASSAQPDSVSGVSDSESEDVDQDAKDMAQRSQGSADKAINAAGAVSAISNKSSQSETDTDESESQVGSDTEAPVSISDDDSVSITATNSAPSGGLAPDGVESSISAMSSAKSSVEDNDTVEASNVIPFSDASKRLAAKHGDEASVTADAIASVASTNAQSKQSSQNGDQRSQDEVGVGESAQVAQSVAQAQVAKSLVRSSTGQTEDASSIQAQAEGQFMDSVGTSVAAGVQQAQQLMQQSDELQTQANEIMAQASNPQSKLSSAQRSQQMARAQQMMNQAVGLEAQAGNILSGVRMQQMQDVAQNKGQNTQAVGSVGSQNSTNRQQMSSPQSQAVSGPMQKQTTQSTAPVANSSMRQAEQNLHQAGQMAKSSVRTGVQGVTQSATGIGNVATGVGRTMSGDFGGAQQAMQGANQAKDGLRQTAQSVRQATSAIGNVGRATINVGQAGLDRTQDVANKATDAIQRVANSNAGRVVGGMVTTGAKVLKPVDNYVSRETSRVWSETASLSDTSQQDASSNYHYDQLDDRRNTTRQSARSYEPRQTSQRERTDARIRRTKRPN